MHKTTHFFLCTLLCMLIAAPMVQARTTWTELSQWSFLRPDVGQWEEVSVPHSLNALDGQSAHYYRGKAYYRKVIHRSANKQFLYVMGAAQRSAVYVNGKLVVEHKGGYTPYSVYLTPYLDNYNSVVQIECDNSLDRNMAPVSSDFNKNNGLHNKIYLVETNDVYCDFQTMGYDAFHVTPLNVSKRSVDVVVNTVVKNLAPARKAVDVVIKLKNKKGKVVASHKQSVVVEPQSSTDVSWKRVLKHPHIWNGLADPYLYTAQVELWQENVMLEDYQCEFGIRSYALDSVHGFVLNGKPYTLRGFSMHQDWQGSASAVTDPQTDKDFEILKELGCNVVRLAHYPHNRYILSQCDRLGLVVQTEIPWVNECGNDTTLYDQKAYTQNLHSQLREMIVNHYNHPSIVFWGMWNELGNIDGSRPQGPKLDKAAVLNTTASLYALAHRLDSTRSVGFADASFGLRTPELKYGTHFDYYAFNAYNGWYQNCKTPDGARNFVKILERLYARAPYVAITEYGSGANPYCHSDNPSLTTRPSVGGARHDEEWGNIVHEHHLQALCSTERLQFSTGWILFDFAVGARREGYMVNADGLDARVDSSYMFLNDKGIVSRDRKVKKDAFYLYKACWNHSEPTLYITSRRYTQRTSDTINVKVYSNLRNLTLYQNGRKVEQLQSSGEPSDVIWTFVPIVFERDNDEILVEAYDNKGRKFTDKVTLHHVAKQT